MNQCLCWMSLWTVVLRWNENHDILFRGHDSRSWFEPVAITPCKRRHSLLLQTYLCIILDPQSEGGRKRREHSSVSGVVEHRHDGHIRAGTGSGGKAGSSRSLLIILYLIVLLRLAQHVVTARGVSLVMDCPAIQMLTYLFLLFLNSGENWETCKWGKG